MPEHGQQSPSDPLDQRLQRMETALEAQRTELAELRAELDRLQHSSTARDFGVQPRKAPVVAGPKDAFSPASEASPLAPASPAETKPEARRSMENRIGSQLFNRIGIIALLIGVALFLKLALDNHWIHPTPTSRTLTGLLLGAGIVLWSERFRRKGYGAFSYSLKAVGTGTLYLSLWASFQLYHLLPAGVVLVAMIGVTAWNAAMAWLQDSELLAVYALVGGFATPSLLGSGGNHESFLFTYVLAMDVAVLLLLWKKPWQRLLLGSFPATAAYFILWYVQFFQASNAGLTGLFVVLLSAPFVAVALIGRQREDAFEGVLAPLAAAAFLSLALYSVLQDSGRHAWLPWGAVVLAALYLLLMRLRRGGLAEPIHLAIALIFLTISIPLKAEGRWITVGWLAEGDILLWVGVRLLGDSVQGRVRAVIRWLGSVALILGVLQSLFVWWQADAQSPFWNARFVTEICAVAAAAVAAWLARGASDLGDAHIAAPSWPLISTIATLTTHLLAAVVVSREIVAFWMRGVADADYRRQLAALSVAAFLMTYGFCLVAWRTEPTRVEDTAHRSLPRAVGLVFLAAGVATMLLAPVDGAPAHAFWNLRLLLELVGAGVLAATVWFARRAQTREPDSALLWTEVAASSFVVFNLLVLFSGVHEIVTYFGAGAAGDAGLAEAFTISAWLMLYAAALLATGFRKRMAFVRWQGLGLLVFTIGKVFLYDVRNLSSIYRVLSFIGLGVLLMGVSFAYQKDWLQLREADSAQTGEGPQ